MEARRATLSLVLDILNSTRTTDIAPALKALRIEERDTLMKYLYRGLEVARTSHSGINCAVLLSWHEKVRTRKLTQLTQLAGTGCIVRVMTDRRVV